MVEQESTGEIGTTFLYDNIAVLSFENINKHEIQCKET